MKTKTERIINALCFGQPRTVESLIKRGELNVNARIRWPYDLDGDGEWWFPLAIAAYEQRTKIFALLLEHGADPNQEGTALLVQQSGLKTLQRMFERAGGQYVKTLTPTQARDAGTQRWMTSTVPELGRAWEARDPDRLRPLFARIANQGVFRDLLEQALEKRDASRVKLLLDSSPFPLDDFPWGRMTSALTPARVELLLKHGVKPEPRTCPSLLELLIGEKKWAVMAKVLEHGADPARLNSGRSWCSLLDLAINRGDSRSFRLLVEHGATPEGRHLDKVRALGWRL